MKYNTIVLFVTTSVLFACNQKSDKNTSKNDIITDTTEVFTYKHSDGRMIDIANIYSGDSSSALVTINGKTEDLPQTDASDSTATYKKGDLELRSVYTHLFLKEGNNAEQELILVNPIMVNYQNNDENIIAEYHTTDSDTPYVIIQRQDGNEYKLKQTSAFSKGASYANDSIKWDTNGDNVVLSINKKEITLKSVPVEEAVKPLRK